MPKLRSLVRETGELTIPSEGDEPLVITYRKRFISPDLADRFVRADEMTGPEQLGVLADLVAALVVSWNLTDDDDQPIPPTRRAIGGLDAEVLQFVATSIQEAMRPDPSSGDGSNSGSSPEARLAVLRPTGTES